MSTFKPWPEPAREPINPRACTQCARLLDAEDLRCVSCGTSRPPSGWLKLPEDEDSANAIEAPTRLPEPRPEPPRPALGLVERAAESAERSGPIPIRILPAPRINLPDAVLDAPERLPVAEPEPPPPVPIPARTEPRSAVGRPEPLRIRLPTIVPGPREVPARDEDSSSSVTAEVPTGESLRNDAVFAGRYRIQETLVRSGGLECYLAIKKPMVRRVVLGVLTTFPAGVDKATLEARFLQECAELARLQRPELARVYDFGRDPHGRCFVVLELIYGLTLREVMNWGPLAESRVASILENLVRGMAEVHKAGIPLRELRSDGILLEPDRDGREKARIASFGLGVAQLPPGGEMDVAPELREGGEPTRSADVYALGALMHRALTGREPGLTEDGDPLANTSPRLASILRRCLAVPDVRYPTALALLAEIESPGPALVAPPAPIVVPASRSNPLLVGLASAAVGALLATWAVLLATSGQPEERAPQSPDTRPPEEMALTIPTPPAPEPAPVVEPEPAPPVKAEPAKVEPAKVEPAPRRADPPPRRTEPVPAPPVEARVEPPPPPPPVEEPPKVETPWTEPVAEAPKAETPAPEPPAKYPAAKALSGLWTGAVDGQSVAMDLKIDGNGVVSGTSRVSIDGTPQSGRVTGLVTPSSEGGWTVELQLQTEAGILTLSGKLDGSSMRGRAIQGGVNIGKWSATR